MSEPARVFELSPPAAFRETRDYVHSTDIYEEIVSGTRGINIPFEGPIELRMRSRMTHRPTYRFGPQEIVTLEGSCASCAFATNAETWHVAVSETPEPILERKSYDESPIHRAAKRLDGAISIDTETGMRPIECITSLAVLLHKQLFASPGEKRWLLAQLNLKRPLEPIDSTEMKIVIDRTIGHSMTRSVAIGADGEIGRLIFLLA